MSPFLLLIYPRLFSVFSDRTPVPRSSGGTWPGLSSSGHGTWVRPITVHPGAFAGTEKRSFSGRVTFARLWAQSCAVSLCHNTRQDYQRVKPKERGAVPWEPRSRHAWSCQRNPWSSWCLLWLKPDEVQSLLPATRTVFTLCIHGAQFVNSIILYPESQEPLSGFSSEAAFPIWGLNSSPPPTQTPLSGRLFQFLLAMILNLRH